MERPSSMTRVNPFHTTVATAGNSQASPATSSKAAPSAHAEVAQRRVQGSIAETAMSFFCSKRQRSDLAPPPTRGGGWGVGWGAAERSEARESKKGGEIVHGHGHGH